MNKSKAKNKSRLSGWITGICIFLAVTLSVGFLSQLGSKKNSGSSGNSGGAGGGSNDYTVIMDGMEPGDTPPVKIDFEKAE